MPAVALETYRLTAADGRQLGTLAAEERDGSAVLGRFTPGADYPAVRHHFAHLEELIDGQVLSLVDQAWDDIDRLGIRVSADGGSALPVTHLILCADGEGSFRLSPDRNGHAPH